MGGGPVAEGGEAAVVACRISGGRRGQGLGGGSCRGECVGGGDKGNHGGRGVGRGHRRRKVGGGCGTGLFRGGRTGVLANCEGALCFGLCGGGLLAGVEVAGVGACSSALGFARALSTLTPALSRGRQREMLLSGFGWGARAFGTFILPFFRWWKRGVWGAFLVGGGLVSAGGWFGRRRVSGRRRTLRLGRLGCG